MVKIILIAASCIFSYPTAAFAQSNEAPVIVSKNADDVSVTIYRDPNRGKGAMNLNYLQGFALISEKRTIILPKGPATVRFEGVAEGMVAVSAIVSDLPGGVLQKNRDRNLLSPASLIDGSLGNRVTIRRTSGATGKVREYDAVIRTGSNGGVVLQSKYGVEALRCSGLPESVIYDDLPEGLSAKPVLSIDTVSDRRVTATVTLTYLASGFDWSAHYVGQLNADATSMKLLSWLTLANMNSESFDSAEVMTVAGRLNIVRAYAQLADRPNAPRLNLTCYPRGNTWSGTPYSPPPRPGLQGAMGDGFGMMEDSIVVTGSRVQRQEMEMAAPVMAASAPPPPPPPVAQQEDLGDLKLYRIPFRSTVSAKGQKQVALLIKDDVPVAPWYIGQMQLRGRVDSMPMPVELRMRNREEDGLGLPLPSGGITVFSPVGGNQLLLGETSLRDYAVDEKFEFTVTTSQQVRFTNTALGDADNSGWEKVELEITNANPRAVDAEIKLGPVAVWQYRGVEEGEITKKDGQYVWSPKVPANGSISLTVEMDEIK